MAKPSKAKNPKANTKKPAKQSAFKPRVRKTTRKQDKAKLKKEASKRPPLPSSFKLSASSFKTIRKFWRPLGGIVLVYLVLNLIFASGLIGSVNSGVNTIKSNLNTSGVHVNKVFNAIGGFSALVGTSGASSSVSGGQSVLLIIDSLVIIWALRQLLAGEKIRVKQAYYQSTSQLIPFILVVLAIVLRLLPVLVGSAGLSLVLSNIAGLGWFIKAPLFLLFIVLASWTLYMISSAIFALYIVTLPNMQPRQALKAAKNLASFRRLQLLRKILFLPLEVSILMGLVIVPLILLVSFLVTPAFLVLSMLAILFAHTYLYSLYREMLE